MDTKKCSKCKKIRPLCDFHKNSGRMRSECKECKNKADRIRSKTKNYINKDRFLNNPQGEYKDRVRHKFYNKIRSGIIKKQVCIVCGEVNAEAHHEDYSKPFDVIFLCKQHHIDLHNGRLKLDDIKCTSLTKK